MVKFVDAGMKDVPSPAKLRRNYYRIVRGMKREIHFLRKLHRMQRYHFRDLLSHLEDAAKVAKFFAEATIVPKGSQVWKDAKAVAAVCAHNVLKEYGGVTTLTEGGPFYVLASILYEGATGKAEQDLSPYCRKLGRLSSRYRMSAPPVRP
jgi:hypothetical protein